MCNVTMMSWPYFLINLTSLLDSDEDPLPPKVCDLFLEIYFPSYKFTVVVKRLDPNITPESRVKEMISNYKSSWLLNKFSLSAP